MFNQRCIFYTFVCIFYCTNCLHFGSVQHSKYQNSHTKSLLRLYSGVDEIEGADEAERAGSSAKDLSKYEIRSKLLEAALLTIRANQSESLLVNQRLTQQLIELTASFDIAQKNNRKLVAEMEKERSDMEVEMKTAFMAANQIERTQQQISKDSAAEILKLKKRLVLLESAYRESEERNKEREIENAFIENARNKMNLLKASLDDKLNEIQILNDIVEEEKSAALDLQDKLEQSETLLENKELEFTNEIQILLNKAEKKIGNLIIEEAEKRAKLEKNIREEFMKEKEKYIRDREEYERNLILEINSKKTRSTENFGDFLKRNIDEEKRNEAENNRRIEQENILQLQRSFLDEAVKLLSGASDRRDPTLSCDSTFSDEFRQQKRLLEKQTDILESLVEKVTSINSCVSMQVIMPGVAMKEVELERQKNDDKEVARYEENDYEGSSRNSNSKKVNIDDVNFDDTDREMTSQITENTPRNVPPYDGIGEELKAATSEAKSTVSSFFSKILNNLSNTAETDDINLAQKNRIKMARKSGRIIRNIGGVLVRSATDTLGFWVGLGFDAEEEEENEVDLRSRGGVSGERKSKREDVSTGDGGSRDKSAYDHEKQTLLLPANSDNLLIAKDAIAEYSSLTDQSVSGRICDIEMFDDNIFDKNTDLQSIKKTENKSSGKLENFTELETDLLGNYQGTKIFLRTGEFGSYFEWNDRKIIIEDKMELNNLTINDAILYIEKNVDANERCSDDSVSTMESESNI